MTEYPVMSPFLTTILKNDKELQARAEATGTPITQVFINADGYQNAPSGNQNGTKYFEYAINSMLSQRQVGMPNYTTPAVDAWVGTNEIAMSFDPVENKLKFDTQHFPIYSGESTPSANDAKPSALYNVTINSDIGTGGFYTENGICLQYSGIVWTALSPPDFWDNTLGFAGAISNVNTTQGKLRFPDGAAPEPAEPNSFEIITTEGVNCTGAFPGLDLGVDSSNTAMGYSRPIYGVPGGTTQSVARQTDDVASIFSSRAWNTSVVDMGYFILDIGTNFTQNLIGANLTTHSTQSIINRYYTANSFTSDNGAGSVIYTHTGEPQMLSNFNVAIRNPDRTLVSGSILQDKNTVFIEVIKAAK